ncbi:FAD-dependent monooxygenase [Noviherbaspirillum galbum]|uniref:FAD-dependent oxidoreductase n=1 Tax=Noviherbaspirillum galbum TaxID=2709383 RepID=A0A6B3SZL3_9BURK|nr:FAD-dependent monooxygenase [Noviherbaspirillum galbum]NEX64852.1 FAD-dependent oxidoreductase [Noviherbaspirillum galbum]
MGKVLIAGAGPTGLTLALWLTAQGIPVRIIDEHGGPGTESRAMVVHARTLELYRQLGLAEGVVAAGHAATRMQFWAEGKPRAALSFGDAGAASTPYPFVLVFPQDRHERLLVQRLDELGVTVERDTALTGFTDTGNHVIAQLRKADGSEESVTTPYLVGCDGARSVVRHRLGTDFEGSTYAHLFYVADVEAKLPGPPGEAQFALDHGDFVAVFPYDDRGLVRLIGTVRDERAGRADSLRFDDIHQDAIRSLGISVSTVNWFSTYHVHHRISSRFRVGRCFLAGDAAHVHSPAGGQGMNTGIADAANLAWKLAAVLHGQAGAGILDSYEAERRAFARQLVDTTDRVFTFITKGGGFAEFVKAHVAPTLLSAASHSDHVRAFMFRLVSQIMVGYQDSPLSQGKVGQVAGGDRLPWVQADGMDNFAPADAIGWQLHVYGNVATDVTAYCSSRGIAVRTFPWTAAHERAGLERDALYLLRPDTYVGLATKDATADTLARYLAALAG